MFPKFKTILEAIKTYVMSPKFQTILDVFLRNVFLFAWILIYAIAYIIFPLQMTGITAVLIIFLCICKLLSYANLFFRKFGSVGGFYADAVGGNITWYYSTSINHDVNPTTGETFPRTGGTIYKNPLAWIFHKVLGIWFMGFSPFVQPYRFEFSKTRVERDGDKFNFIHEKLDDKYMVPERMLVDIISKGVDIADKTVFDLHTNYPINVIHVRKAHEFDKTQGVIDYTSPRIWTLLHEELNESGITYKSVLKADSSKFFDGVKRLDNALNEKGINIKVKEFAIVDKIPGNDPTRELLKAATETELAEERKKQAVIKSAGEKEAKMNANLALADELDKRNNALRVEAEIWKDPKAMALAKTNVHTLAGSDIGVVIGGNK